MESLASLIRLGRVSSALALPAERLRGLGLDAYDPARDADAPAFFIGLYGAADMAALQAHRGPAVQMFCGGDARNGRWAAPTLAALRPRVRVLASPTLLADLHRAEIQVDVVHGVYTGDSSLFTPHSLGDRVYAYVPYERRDEYGIDLLAQIMARLRTSSGVFMYLGRWGDHPPPFANAIPLPAWYNPRLMPYVYGHSFCGIRTIVRDGFPGTPVELALMGRPVATMIDCGVPWIDYAPTVDAMVAFISAARAQKGTGLPGCGGGAGARGGSVVPAVALTLCAHAGTFAAMRLRSDLAALDKEAAALGDEFDRCMKRAAELDTDLPGSEEAKSYRAQARHAKAKMEEADRPWLKIGQWVRAHTLDHVVVGDGKIISRDPRMDRFTVHFPERRGTDIFGADQLRTIDRPRRA